MLSYIQNMRNLHNKYYFIKIRDIQEREIMNYWDIKLGFFHHLQKNQADFNVKDYYAGEVLPTEGKKIGFNIFNNETALNDYMTNVIKVDDIGANFFLADIDKLELVDGKLVNPNMTLSEKQAEQEQNEFTFTDFLNAMLEEEEIAKIIDTDEKNGISKEEIREFLNKINIVDEEDLENDTKNLSLKEIVSGIIKIATGKFNNVETNNKVEETKATPETKTEESKPEETKAQEVKPEEKAETKVATAPTTTVQAQTPQATQNNDWQQDPQYSWMQEVDNNLAQQEANYPPTNYEQPNYASTNYSAPVGDYSAPVQNADVSGAAAPSVAAEPKAETVQTMSKEKLEQDLAAAKETVTQKQTRINEVQSETAPEIKALKEAEQAAYKAYQEGLMKINLGNALLLGTYKTAVDEAQKTYDADHQALLTATDNEANAQKTFDIASSTLSEYEARLTRLKSVKIDASNAESQKKHNEKLAKLTGLVAEKRTAKTNAETALKEAQTAKKTAEEKEKASAKILETQKKTLADFEAKILEDNPTIKEAQDKWHEAQKALQTKKPELLGTAQEELKTAQAKVIEIEKELAARKTKEDLKEFTTGVQYTQEEINMMKAKGWKLATTKDGYQYFHTPWGRYRKGIIQDELLEKLQLVEQFARENNLILVRNDGERTNAESNAGRAKKGSLVCKGGQSPHNYGTAADLMLYDKNGKCYDFAKTNEGRMIGEYAQSVGLRWGALKKYGGDYSKKADEQHHFELPNWEARFKNMANHVETRAKNLQSYAA